MIRKERAGVFREHSVQFDTHGLVPQHLRDIDRESETAPPFAEQAWLKGGKSFSRQLVVARQLLGTKSKQFTWCIRRRTTNIFGSCRGRFRLKTRFFQSG